MNFRLTHRRAIAIDSLLRLPIKLLLQQIFSGNPGGPTLCILSGAILFTSIEVSDRRLRFYGATALLTCRSEVSGTAAGSDISGSYRYTRVYVRDAQGK